MTKEEIIKLLQKEVGFLNISNGEDELGNEIITEAHFKSIGEMLVELDDKREKYEEMHKLLKEKVESEGKLYVSDSGFSNCDVKLDGDLILLENAFMNGCILDSKIIMA